MAEAGAAPPAAIDLAERGGRSGAYRELVLRDPEGGGLVGRVTLVGTAHVSRKSCDEVTRVIKEEAPDAVFVELCEERRQLLFLDSSELLRPPTLGESLESLRTGRETLFSVLYSWVLSSAAEGLDVFPGGEFRAAFQAASRLSPPAQLLLGDRPVSVTVSRVWACMTAWEKCRMVFHLLFTGLSMPSPDELRGLVEEMKDADVLTETVKQLSREYPSLVGPLIDERDRFMVLTLRTCLYRGHFQLRWRKHHPRDGETPPDAPAARPFRVVAVVGAGHIPGIVAHWEDDDIDEEDLMERPEDARRRQPPGAGVLLLGTAVVAAAVTASLLYLERRAHAAAPREELLLGAAAFRPAK